ncbi:uncharacterized protein LOC114354539 [Ostrinia furnacalis]|uniref:uncharacterized protein LOC114354539 n=1 Tax=Ostrinia furnacalis TaxID=93504 RepID=UPI00103BB725|nr:uncharacterized protein LOC114354539 [Ostrinia furnacalis]
MNLNSSPNPNVNTRRGSSKPTKGKRSENANPTIPTEEIASENMSLEFRRLRQKMDEQHSDINLLRIDFLDVKQHLASVTKLMERLEAQKKKINGQAYEISILKTSLAESRYALNLQEQNYLKNELEIAGVPESEGENPHHIALVTATKLGVDLSAADIDFVHRTGTRQNNSGNKNHLPRTIVLRLNRRSKREEIIKAARSRRNLNSEDISSGPVTRIYVDERLTKANRLLFRETRTRALQYGFRYCWVNNGYVHVRQAERKPSIHIKSLEELDRLVGPSQAKVSQPPDE